MAEKKIEVKLFNEGSSSVISESQDLVGGGFEQFIQAVPRDKRIFQPGRTRAGELKKEEIKCSDKDVLELTLDNELVLFTSVQRLKEDFIIPKQQRSGEKGALLLPSQLSFSSQRTRGEEGFLVKSLKVLDIKSKVIKGVGGQAGKFTARALAEKIEKQLVGEQILYRLHDKEPNGAQDVVLKPAVPEQIDVSRPLLLFIHGTASSTQSCFSALWREQHDETWEKIRAEYNDNIFALEHHTLTRSPIDNAVELMEKLPANARLHLVSHSRGGLVGELLCRSHISGAREPFSPDDLELFEENTLPAPLKLFGEIPGDYRNHRKQLKRLNTLLVEKKPVIEKFVRVACPARGTTLASGKLDMYLSGILNVIGLIPALKASPVYNFLKAFVLAVAKERTKPEQLPGLEVQMPGSPFIAMLNSVNETVEASLTVIKGDIEPTGILKKIGMFFLDQFYESDHDLVINTPSMDGGSTRLHPIMVLFDQGEEVNHFEYFSNKKTRQGLYHGLTDSHVPPQGFTLAVQKPQVIARSVPRGKKSGEIPTVFILPGINGSHLSVDGNRIWMDSFDLVRGKFAKLDIDAKHVRAQEPFASTYGKLIDFLSDTHEVIPFGYDWRRSVLDLGRELGGAVDERLRNSDQPVQIIAHSTGGLVTRGMMTECPEVWNRMRARQCSRVLMLGTPNRGSHCIYRIFARQDKLIKMLALADLRHNQNELLQIIRQFPGVLELLPVDKEGKQLIPEIWSEFKKVLKKGWQAPLKKDLKKAQSTWNELIKTDLDPNHVFYIAGQAEETPVSVSIEDEGNGPRIIFKATPRGDGQVPWETGIPQNCRHWYVNAVHGDIPGYKAAFEGIREILDTGTTQQLATQPSISRALVEENVMLPDTIDVFPSRDLLEAAALGKDIHGRSKDLMVLPQLKVSVTHSNLSFAKSPLATGHYQGDMIISAEAAIDARLGNRLRKRLQLGIYPGPLMTSEIIFGNSETQFPGAIIVGLGEAGNLSGGELATSFRDAVIRYVLVGEEKNYFKDKAINLSTLLIGTGAGGITISESITAILRGVLRANRLLAGPAHNVDRVVSKIAFLELYQDTAIEAQHMLLKVCNGAEFAKGVIPEDRIVIGEGGRIRAFFKEPADWWFRLRIETSRDGSLKYTSLGAGARAVERSLSIQRHSVEPLLRELTNSPAVNTRAGRALFELLLPALFKAHSDEDQNLVLVVDEESANYPWELLEYEGREGSQALAIKAGLIRQLVTQDIVPNDLCTELRALVIGEPLLGADSPFSQLPGACAEARTVANLLQRAGVKDAGARINSTGTEILTELMTTKYGILHLAGHGVVNYRLEPQNSAEDRAYTSGNASRPITGMVIGKDHFLTAVELGQMPYTPSFVFINCCHLGQTASGQQDRLDQPNVFAASLATQLIKQGVRAVIAAGWAVDDKAALTFAHEFYEAFLGGLEFGEAVKRARTLTQKQHPRVNTWGAYQCYGDPGFKITDIRQGQIVSAKQTYVSLYEYIVAIRNISEDARTASAETARNLIDQLKELFKGIPAEYADDAELLEVEALAWGELDCFEKAIDAYKRALTNQKATASIKCAEQCTNLMVRHAVEVYHRGQKEEAVQSIEEAIGDLKTLNNTFSDTTERLVLLGGAYRRQAEIFCTNRKLLLKALKNMQLYYQQAFDQSKALSGKMYAYPLINRLAANWLISIVDPAVKIHRDFDSMLQQAKNSTMVPDINRESFWQAIAENECNLLEALKNGQLDEYKESIGKKYLEIRNVAASPRQFRSVLENISFLHDVTEELGNDQSSHLQWLLDQLKSL